ncbi:MAG: hypothetical protein QW208_06280 [Acidilobaceae archaeon]
MVLLLYKSRGVIPLILIVYIITAILLAILTYPEPSYNGLLLRDDYRVILFSDSVVSIIKDNSTIVILKDASILLDEVGKPCYSGGSELYIATEDKLILVSHVDGVDLRSLILPFKLNNYGLWCSDNTLVVSGFSKGILRVLRVDTSNLKATIWSINTSMVGETYTLVHNNVIYVAVSSLIVEITDLNIKVYKLVENMDIKGLTLDRDSLIAYGSRDSGSFIYRFDEREVIVIEVPGRISHADVVLCEDYWCRALIRPEGDWPFIIEFKLWSYISDAKFIGLKPFIYYSAGASNSIWFSGKLVDEGTIVLSIKSTRKAIIGESSLKAFFLTEEVKPNPRINKFKIPPEIEVVKSSVDQVKLIEESISFSTISIPIVKIKAIESRMEKIFTVIVISAPIIAYIARKILNITTNTL